MGFLDKAARLFEFNRHSGFGDTFVLSSPFATGTGLAPVIATDLGYTGTGMPATPAEALAVPPINRGIALLTTLIADLRLTYADGTDLDDADAWLNTTEGSITPGQRWAALLQDLVLHRDSCMWVDRKEGGIVGGLKIPRELWSLDAFGQIVVDGRPAPDQSGFLYFQSLMPLGLLEAAASAIEHYHDLRNTIRSRSRNPIPMIELHLTEEFEGSAKELEKAQKDWSIARQAENGAVAFTPKGVELITHTGAINDGEMLIAARNALRLDAGNFLNLPASLLEGANGTSGTYENTLQTKDELVSLSLRQWLTPIEQRLSQDDVTATGKRVKFDLTSLTPDNDPRGNTGTAQPPAALPAAPTTEQDNA